VSTDCQGVRVRNVGRPECWQDPSVLVRSCRSASTGFSTPGHPLHLEEWPTPSDAPCPQAGRTCGVRLGDQDERRVHVDALPVRVESTRPGRCCRDTRGFRRGVRLPTWQTLSDLQPGSTMTSPRCHALSEALERCTSSTPLGAGIVSLLGLRARHHCMAHGNCSRACSAICHAMRR
jgi:hypothetical protein